MYPNNQWASPNSQDPLKKGNFLCLTWAKAFTAPYNHSSAVSGANCFQDFSFECVFLSNLMPFLSPSILYLFAKSFSSSIHFTEKDKGRQIYFTLIDFLDLWFRRVELKLNLGTENYKRKRHTICSINSLIALWLLYACNIGLPPRILFNYNSKLS